MNYQIVEFHGAFDSLGALVQVVMAEGTNGNHVFSAGVHTFLNTESGILRRPVAVSGHSTPTAATAVGIAADSIHFPEIDTRNGFQHFPGNVIQAIFLIFAQK